MDAANAAAAERGSFLNSSRAVVEKGGTPSHYRIYPAVGNVVAENILASICRAKNVSRPVG